MWHDAHYFKGLHRTFPAANVARPVPAVSGACMMIDRALYEELGGLSGKYVRGDYEDSDLCLRLIENGREQLVPARRRALPPRGAVLPAERAHPGQPLQRVAPHPPLGEKIAELMKADGSASD